MPDDIIIRGVKPNGKLDLSDGDTTEVKSGAIFPWSRNVTWKIDAPEIESIRIVAKTTHYPFKDPLPLDYDIKVKVRVPFRESGINWEYEIYWKDKATQTEHRSDPIISIRPSVNILEILFLLVIVFGLAFTIRTFFVRPKN